ncbi:MAG: DMT family transporter, partial [Chloroflexota bacterium]
AGAAVGFGAAYPLTAVALRSFAPLGAAAIQSSIALVIVLALAATRVLPRPGAGARSRDGLVRLLVLGLLGGVGFITGMNVAVHLAGPAITGFVASLYAVFAALFAVPLLGERLRPATVAAFGLALVGTLLLAGFEPLDTNVAGIAFGLFAAVAFGLYLVLSRRWIASTGLDGTSITMANLIGRGPFLLVVQLLLDPAGLRPDPLLPESAVALVGLVLLPSLMSQLLIVASVKRVPARRTSASLLITPLTSAAISVAFLGDHLTPIEAAGAFLVVLGIAGASGAVGPAVGRLLGRRPDAPAPADRLTR